MALGVGLDAYSSNNNPLPLPAPSDPSNTTGFLRPSPAPLSIIGETDSCSSDVLDPMGSFDWVSAPFGIFHTLESHRSLGPR